MSSTSETLSQGTSEQAASVEETTASLEQMSASITQNADNSRTTEQTAVKGAVDAEESRIAAAGDQARRAHHPHIQLEARARESRSFRRRQRHRIQPRPAQLGQPALHRHVDVLVRGLEREAAAFELAEDRREPALEARALGARQQACADERAHVGHAARDVVRVEDAVDGQGRREGLDERRRHLERGLVREERRALGQRANDAGEAKAAQALEKRRREEAGAFEVAEIVLGEPLHHLMDALRGLATSSVGNRMGGLDHFEPLGGDAIAVAGDDETFERALPGILERLGHGA